MPWWGWLVIVAVAGGILALASVLLGSGRARADTPDFAWGRNAIDSITGGLSGGVNDSNRESTERETMRQVDEALASFGA